MQALEAAQNPRLTAKETTATQDLDPKQTQASEGAIIFLQIIEDATNRKSKLKPPHAGRQNTSGTDLQTIKAQQPARSAISWNQAIENNRKDHLYRKN